LSPVAEAQFRGCLAGGTRIGSGRAENCCFLYMSDDNWQSLFQLNLFSAVR
jgi:hypothetical protein